MEIMTMAMMGVATTEWMMMMIIMTMMIIMILEIVLTMIKII